MQLLDLASAHIWTPYKEFKVRRDQNGIEMAASIKQVDNTVSFNSSKWVFETRASSQIAPDRGCFKSDFSDRGTVVLADRTLVAWTSIGLARVSHCLRRRHSSIMMLHRNYFVYIYRSRCIVGIVLSG
jgi:hypothetical protein